MIVITVISYLQKGNLHSLPLLLDNYVPDMSGLPMYALRLATEVDWDSEKDCFETFARETAKFYQFHKNFIGINALDNNVRSYYKFILFFKTFLTFFKYNLFPPFFFSLKG